jgi:hypothetical protein
MTHLLERAFAEAKKLDPDEQDALAERILADLRDEQLWDESFAGTTDEEWDEMVQSVREEIKSHETKDLRNVIR